jgi:hypothetical protein
VARPRCRHRAKTGDGSGNSPAAVCGHGHGRRLRSLTGTFGQVQINVPRARLNTPDGKTTECAGPPDVRGIDIAVDVASIMAFIAMQPRPRISSG